MTPNRPLSLRVRQRRRVAGAVVVTIIGLAAAWSMSGPGPSLPTDLARIAPIAHARVPVPFRGRARSAGTYAHTGVGQFAAATRGVPYRLYVPESAGTGVDVVDPLTLTVLGHYPTGLDPQHVVPSYDLKTLWSTNDLANTVTPFDPLTGRPKGPSKAVNDPYNMYFLPGGREAMVVQEQLQQLGFYDAQTMAPTSVVHVDCPGVDHADFSADERFLVASCEFGHRLLRMDVATKKVTGYLDLPGSSPQDVRLSPDGNLFYVADKNAGGVHLISASTFIRVGFLKTGPDAHGIYPSRDGRSLYVSNRGNGTISVINAATRTIRATWTLPRGGSPDMGGVSPDGRSLWLTGRYNATIYQISTNDGHLIAQVHIPKKPHGMCVWPQPGRYSLGHTGNMR